ncbi:Solute carrier family 2, facilitated glucose transporter member 5 [Pseudolycoriella hygida]|uniref:Solute carrier family 2, facilitated glucose transporter member 5 n=1 Tax=Pseudolycoriella hygida TaxID=35572 RepID=A0A9Q0RVQ6_9DIPT|nr:Solute carrier family 2, facilitated glucose transporter member 5 [Pseudolycoriella hygida]
MNQSKFPFEGSVFQSVYTKKPSETNEMEKSKQSLYEMDAIPANKSSIHQKDNTFSHSNLQHDNQQLRKGTKTDFRLEKISPEPVNSTSHSTYTTHYEQSERYFRRLYTNRRQTASITGALFLMLASGIHIAWGIWRSGVFAIATNMSLLIFSVMVWPIGAIFGGFLGSALIVVLKKSIIYCITAAIMTVGNVLLVIWDRNYAVIVICRLLTSVGYGAAFIAVITHAGENASRNMRGIIVSTINCMLFVGIFISLHVTGAVPVYADFSSERILAIITLIFIVASVICTITATIETVPYLLRKNRTVDALENMKNLRGVAIESPQLKSEMDELKLMIIQDKEDNRNVFANGNVKPLLLILSIRLMAALTNNYSINLICVAFGERVLYHHQYAPLMIIAPRVATSALQIFYADFFARKVQLIVSATLAGLFLVVFGVLFNTLNITWMERYYIPCIFAMYFQFFCGMGIQQMADVYLSEAFSTSKKPWSLSSIILIEHSFQIFMTGMAFVPISRGGLNALIFATGILVILITVVLMFVMPETKGKTLKQTRDLFRSQKILHLDMKSSPYG